MYNISRNDSDGRKSSVRKIILLQKDFYFFLNVSLEMSENRYTKFHIKLKQLQVNCNVEDDMKGKTWHGRTTSEIA